jgi:hypothetical protein
MADYTAIKYNVPYSDGSAGGLRLITTTTASSDSTISFTSGIDSTYKEYIFIFNNIHPATDNVDFTFQVDTGTNTSYNQTMTTTVFRALHDEADTAASMSYDSGRDQAQGTAFQILAHEIGNGNDENMSGSLHLFEPSSATYVKHFMATLSLYAASNMSENKYVAGYVNTTTALTRVQFKMSSDAIEAGTIKLYGIT